MTTVFSLFLPVNYRYLIVYLSIGKNPIVAPYSGDILAIVARSARVKEAQPSPKNSTNFPTTPRSLSFYVIVSTKSVAVVVGGSFPVNLNPTTSGNTIDIGWPSITASASMPPTPQPVTPNPLIIVVWESVPTTESGYKI